MQINIYNTHSAESYKEQVGKWLDSLDVYYDPAFLSCDAEMQNGAFEIFTALNNNDIFIYPYIKLAIPGYPDHFDLSSPYGYAGPYCTNTDLFTKAEKAFNDHISKAGCVTEFVRYHYLYNETRLFTENIQNIHNRDVVVADLSKGWDHLWNDQYSTTNRNLVRRLEKDGFTVNFHKDTIHLDAFISMYELTMKNANATQFYFFPRSFYYKLFEKLGEKIGMASVERDNHTYASTLFFKSGDILTYYLSARDIDHYKIPSSNFMLSEIAKYGMENSINTFNLGGGTTHSDEDSLYKFKRNFSKNIKKFYIGKRIHNHAIYDELKQQFIKEYGEEKFAQQKHLLQFYR
jgi:lipid II:glycine glycyltransferase (peptidoglycan interpeptide bridge formation enzyme)